MCVLNCRALLLDSCPAVTGQDAGKHRTLQALSTLRFCSTSCEGHYPLFGGALGPASFPGARSRTSDLQGLPAVATEYTPCRRIGGQCDVHKGLRDAGISSRGAVGACFAVRAIPFGNYIGEAKRL